jgi:hypothetical protein
MESLVLSSFHQNIFVLRAKNAKRPSSTFGKDFLRMTFGNFAYQQWATGHQMETYHYNLENINTKSVTGIQESCLPPYISGACNAGIPSQTFPKCSVGPSRIQSMSQCL